MEKNSKGLFSPIMQAGFAGMCVLLLSLIFWQMNRTDCWMNRMMEVQVETNKVIERNTQAIEELSRIVHDKV